MQDLTQSELDALTNVLGSAYSGQLNVASSGPLHANASKVHLPQLRETLEGSPQTTPAQAVLKAQVRVDAIFGKSMISIEDLLALRPGSVLQLDKLAGELVDLEINGTVLAKGEIVVIDDRFGVRIIEAYNA